jgi:putative acetyltransferase
MIVRPEQAPDVAAVRAVNLAAFPTPAEADLVDALRNQARPLVSLVAELDGEIVGHILFSPVTLDAQPALRLMGLAPMAVRPSHQRRGIGAALLRAGLDRCREQGAQAVIVLGHPGYYPRFGFTPAATGSSAGLRCEYDAPQDAFMQVELVPGSLTGVAGTVRFHPAFRAL